MSCACDAAALGSPASRTRFQNHSDGGSGFFKKTSNQAVDAWCNPCFGESIAHKPARTLELHGFRQLNCIGHLFGFTTRIRKLPVKRVRRVKTRRVAIRLAAHALGNPDRGDAGKIIRLQRELARAQGSEIFQVSLALLLAPLIAGLILGADEAMGAAMTIGPHVEVAARLPDGRLDVLTIWLG
jgi:hypothetical protein